MRLRKACRLPLEYFFFLRCFSNHFSNWLRQSKRTVNLVVISTGFTENFPVVVLKFSYQMQKLPHSRKQVFDSSAAGSLLFRPDHWLSRKYLICKDVSPKWEWLSVNVSVPRAHFEMSHSWMIRESRAKAESFPLFQNQLRRRSESGVDHRLDRPPFDAEQRAFYCAGVSPELSSEQLRQPWHNLPSNEHCADLSREFYLHSFGYLMMPMRDESYFFQLRYIRCCDWLRSCQFFGDNLRISTTVKTAKK